MARKIKLKHAVVYENVLKKFNGGHFGIKAKVTIALESLIILFSKLTTDDSKLQMEPKYILYKYKIYILYKYKIYFILVLWSLVVVGNSIFKVTALCSPSGANHGSKLTTSASADGSVCIEVYYKYHAT